MRAKNDDPERRLEAALGALRDALDASGAPWMIIGGLALIARGVQRMTVDVDAVVRGDAIDVSKLLTILKGREIVPRVPKAAAFAEANLVLLLRHRTSGVDLDVSLAWTRFEHEALEKRQSVRYGRVRVPTARPADLVVMKAVAARPKDMEDVEALLALHPSIDRAKARATLVELARLAESPELVRAFDDICARLDRASRPLGSRAPKAPRGVSSTPRRGKGPVPRKK